MNNLYAVSFSWLDEIEVKVMRKGNEDTKIKQKKVRETVHVSASNCGEAEKIAEGTYGSLLDFHVVGVKEMKVRNIIIDKKVIYGEV